MRSLPRIAWILLSSTALLSRVLPPDDEDAPSAERTHWEHLNECCASDSLNTLTAAEADFRANDRDWCNVNDFWTGEVRGLYTLSPSAEGEQPGVRLIELSVAAFDDEEETSD